MSIYTKLAQVQQELKAPKNQRNSFGGYNYRSAEGILEAVKPLLAKHGLTIVISDSIIEVGGRVFVEADVEAIDLENDGSAPFVCHVNGFAELEESKKGMDKSQITGTASSYARKYALNALLLIDDTKDADTDEFAKQTGAEKKEFADPDAKISAETAALIEKMAKDAKVDLKAVCAKPLGEFTNKQAGTLIESLKKRIGG